LIFFDFKARGKTHEASGDSRYSIKKTEGKVTVIVQTLLFFLGSDSEADSGKDDD
jgi:hypothetical protein